MLGKSMKWILLTLAIIVGLFFGVRAAVRALIPEPGLPAPTAVPEAAPTATAAPTAKPFAEPSAGPTPSETPEPTPTPRVITEEERLAEAYVSEMSMKDKLGQLVMFGFTSSTDATSEYRSIIKNYHVGNIALYGINVERNREDGGFSQTSRLITRIKSLNRQEVPMLISIDLEGGRVQRFTWADAPVSANTLGKKNDYQRAYDQYLRVGQKLLETGINVNLAPVLDIAKSPMKTFLTTRIISSDADIAAKIGGAMIDGTHAAGLLATAKHFPGHGTTLEDTHATTPVVGKTYEELNGYELVPFRAGVAAGVDLILVAHIHFTALDEEHIASMSEKVITGLLREDLGFDGVVMSDDFRMAGLTGRYDVGDAAVRFILAGGDLILCGARDDLQLKIMQALTAAAADGTLPEERINESVVRILAKKMKVTDWRPAAQTEEAAA